MLQLTRAIAFGGHTDSEPVGKTDYAAEEAFCVYDRSTEARDPILIRIQNCGTTAIKYAEDLGSCTAEKFTGIIRGGTVVDDGEGGTVEWQKNRPKNIYIYGADAYRCKITKRYGPEN